MSDKGDRMTYSEKRQKLLMDAAWDLKAKLLDSPGVTPEMRADGPAILTELINKAERIFRVEHPELHQ